MENMHWVEPLISIGKQERETLGIMEYHSKVANMGFHSEVQNIDVRHPQLAYTHPARRSAAPCPTPACGTNDQDYHISPFSQHTACDGSLSDMLLPYQYDKTLDDLLSEQEESFVQELAPGAQVNEPSQFNRPSHIDGSIVFNEKFQIDDGTIINDIQLPSAIPQPNHDGIIINDVQLPPAIPQLNHDAQSVVLLPPLPPLAPPPAHTRRPPMRKGTPSYRENHIHSERQRRQDMTSLFNRLKSVLPTMQHDDLKGDRCTLLGHVIDYVQELHDQMQSLGKVKAELIQGEEGAKRNMEEDTLINNHHLAQQAILASVDSVSVRSWGQVDIFITLNCPKQRGLWPNLLAVLQDTLQLDVQNVALSSTPLFCVHSIYAKLVVADDNEETCCKVKKALRDFISRL